MLSLRSLRFRQLSATGLAAFVLFVCTRSAHAEDSPPIASFVIIANAATTEANPVSTSQAFSKQWKIKADAESTISAIEVLALDLPGQVFITYAAADNNTSSLFGEIKVFGTTETFVNSVTITSKRAMTGAKLVVTKSSSSAIVTSTSSEFLLTEIVLRHKMALKKVVANGWADVVIADNVLFTNKKEDYDFSAARALRTESATASFTVQDGLRQAISSTSGSNLARPNRTIIYPTGDNRDEVTINVRNYHPAYAYFRRVDSDLLPDGSIGTVETMNGDADVAGIIADGASEETLVMRPKANSANSANATINVNLAPNVKMSTLTHIESDGKETTIKGELARNFPDDAVTLFLNGTGNLFVLANASSMYVKEASFHVTGTGFIQVEIGEIRAVGGVFAIVDFFATQSSSSAMTGAVVRAKKICMWSPTSYGMGYANNEPVAADGKVARCEVVTVPVKVGGTKAVANTTTATPSTASGVAGPTVQRALMAIVAAIIPAMYAQ